MDIFPHEREKYSGQSISRTLPLDAVLAVKKKHSGRSISRIL